MLRGIYTSAAGMIMQMDSVSMHAGNIANAQTAGFKKREMTSVPFKELMIDIISEKGEDDDRMFASGRPMRSISVPIGTGSGASYMMVDKTQGSMKPTGNPLDIAISGDAYFAVEKKPMGNTPAGSPPEIYQTKNGRFLLDEQGYMITAEGDYLLADTGRVKISSQMNRGATQSLQEKINIREDGRIFDGANLVGKLKLFVPNGQMAYIQELKLESPVLEEAKVGPNGRYITPGGVDAGVKLRQGFLEGSNVNIIQEMINLIHSSKNYESGHKLIMNEDKILDKAINELGRTG